MWLRIVEKTGNKSIREAQESISLDEFHIWKRLFMSHPWGYEIENLRCDILNNIVAQFAGAKGDPVLIDDIVRESANPDAVRAEKMLAMIKSMRGKNNGS